MDGRQFDVLALDVGDAMDTIAEQHGIGRSDIAYATALFPCYNMAA